VCACVRVCLCTCVPVCLCACVPVCLCAYGRKEQRRKDKRAEEMKKKRKAANLSFAVDELEGDVDAMDAAAGAGAAAPAPVGGGRAALAPPKIVVGGAGGAGSAGGPASPSAVASPRAEAGAGAASGTPVAGTPVTPGTAAVAAARAAAGGGGGGGVGAAADDGGVKLLKKARFGKDPTVETSFLPDKDREVAEKAMREQLKQEWLVKQEKIKKERLNVTYSYWDGSGHRREIIIPKGTTIAKFLEWVRQDMMDEFPELKAVSAENLLYIKEDLIIPHVRRVWRGVGAGASWSDRAAAGVVWCGAVWCGVVWCGVVWCGVVWCAAASQQAAAACVVCTCARAPPSAILLLRPHHFQGPWKVRALVPL
jgi:hypothetical protein